MAAPFDNSDTKTRVLIGEYFLAWWIYLSFVLLDTLSLSFQLFCPNLRGVWIGPVVNGGQILIQVFRRQINPLPNRTNETLETYLNKRVWPLPLMKGLKRWERNLLHIELETLTPQNPSRCYLVFARHLKNTVDPFIQEKQPRLVSVSDMSVHTMLSIAQLDNKYRSYFELQPPGKPDLPRWEQGFNFLVLSRDRHETPLHLKSYINLFMAEVLAGAGCCIFPWILVNTALVQLDCTVSHHDLVYMPPRLRACVINQLEKVESLRTMLKSRRSRWREPVTYLLRQILSLLSGENCIQDSLTWLRSQGRRPRQITGEPQRLKDDGCLEVVEDGMNKYIPGQGKEVEDALDPGLTFIDGLETIALQQVNGEVEEANIGGIQWEVPDYSRNSPTHNNDHLHEYWGIDTPTEEGNLSPDNED
ncbi:hypothetical protein MKZ38_005209 [Zalerion maritima]|uniref:Uncharacterized protein n=1 Tax=Zalerion maritima TaxID=339359 RepID=A0AAD5RRB2_9PEZI|nr:hypothetical protein MKZ38_005209 [Zalerion maritima]